MAVPMANGPPFATLNHVAADLGIPNESEPLRVGMSLLLPLRLEFAQRVGPRSSGTTPTIQASVDFDAGLRYGGLPIARLIGKLGAKCPRRHGSGLQAELGHARL